MHAIICVLVIAYHTEYYLNHFGKEILLPRATDDAHSDKLDGMFITLTFTSEKKPMTILIGQIRDRTALSGVLNELYKMHLPY